MLQTQATTWDHEPRLNVQSRHSQSAKPSGQSAPRRLRQRHDMTQAAKPTLELDPFSAHAADGASNEGVGGAEQHGVVNRQP
jgi:hypothetical protein